LARSGIIGYYLKGLSHERGWLKPVANSGASPFKKHLSNGTTFCPINLAGSPFNIYNLFEKEKMTLKVCIIEKIYQ
jgi:hypothetical protein